MFQALGIEYISFLEINPFTFYMQALNMRWHLE